MHNGDQCSSQPQELFCHVASPKGEMILMFTFVPKKHLKLHYSCDPTLNLTTFNNLYKYNYIIYLPTYISSIYIYTHIIKRTFIADCSSSWI
jgi:hypothetical protein